MRVVSGALVAALGLAVLAACTPEPVVVVPAESFRNQSAQIASQTNVTAARMAGDWHIRQRFADTTTPFPNLTFIEAANGALQLSVAQIFCRADLCEAETVVVDLSPSGPGRWSAVGAQSLLGGGEIWVMWMDFDSRTAAIGTPSGEFGWIMDKNPTGGGDRIVAARDIMDWFGYDTTRLEKVIP